MQTQVEKLDKARVALQVEVDPEQVDAALHRAYQKLVRQVNIPGFRRGKVPRRVFESYVGKASLYNEALDEIIPQAYQQAVEENNVEPVAQPELEVVQMEEGQPLIFKATVAVKPEVELGEYKGLEIEKPPVEVTEEEVTAELQALQRRYAKLVPVEEGEVVPGDMILIDFHGQVEGSSFPGGDGENYPLEVGAGNLIAGFEEQLVGARGGETREVRVSYPQDYAAGELAGKEAVFQVTVKEIKRPEYAAVDDDFAQDVSEFATLQELKDDIRRRLGEAKEEQVANDMRRQIVEKAVEQAVIEIPESMIAIQVDAAMASLEHTLKQQDLSLAEYLEIRKLKEEELREQYREGVIRDIRQELALEAIAKKENISVSEAEIEEEINRTAQKYHQDADQIRLDLGEAGIEMVRKNLLARNTIDFLLAYANKRGGEG